MYLWSGPMMSIILPFGTWTSDLINNVAFGMRVSYKKIRRSGISILLVGYGSLSPSSSGASVSVT